MANKPETTCIKMMRSSSRALDRQRRITFVTIIGVWEPCNDGQHSVVEEMSRFRDEISRRSRCSMEISRSLMTSQFCQCLDGVRTEKNVMFEKFISNKSLNLSRFRR
ncbi:hypothetical protein L484_002871 [Morus notabilis]|uniref:Uncharacterized protein n=1 Tax=Morus notabilis TaxID=981085 RepID=W9RLW0_9ROSA|nr:hypothetical protein L484_002871 [Morus notabilis]